MIIDGKPIGTKFKPYIIAELSANHGGSIERAKICIKEAARCGVSAVKIQTYTPDTMTIKCNKPDFFISNGLWKGKQLYELYQTAFTPFEWHQELFDFAKCNNITLISTPFDESAVDLLEELSIPAYKIASFEIVDLPLIEYIATKNKPILLSTGMANVEEIRDAITAIRKMSNVDILLFHCISSYPAPTKESNLSNIEYLKNTFGVEVGLSDHTISNLASTVAIGMGAVAIEKHFKLDDQDCGPDSSFSLNISQLSNLVFDCEEAWHAKGIAGFKRSKIEKDNLVFRRSIYFVKDIKKGETITKEHIRRIRPGYGLPPKYIDEILGKKVSKDCEKGDALKWNLLID